MALDGEMVFATWRSVLANDLKAGQDYSTAHIASFILIRNLDWDEDPKAFSKVCNFLVGMAPAIPEARRGESKTIAGAMARPWLWSKR